MSQPAAARIDDLKVKPGSPRPARRARSRRHARPRRQGSRERGAGGGRRGDRRSCRTGCSPSGSGRCWSCCRASTPRGKDGTIRKRVQHHEPARRHVTAVRRAERGGAGARLLWRIHLACPQARHDRHLQPLALRGRAGRRRCASSRRQNEIEQRYDADQRVREDARRERHDDPEVHAAHLEEGAGRAAAGAARRAAEALEVQPRRSRGPQAVGRVPGRLRDRAEALLDAHGRPGTSSRPTANGRATPPSRPSCARRSSAWIPQYPKPDWKPSDFKIPE